MSYVDIGGGRGWRDGVQSVMTASHFSDNDIRQTLSVSGAPSAWFSEAQQRILPFVPGAVTESCMCLKSSIYWDVTPCYPVLVSYSIARLYVTANGYWWFILYYGRANGNWLAVFHFPPVSYVFRNFCKPIVLLVTCFHAGFLLGLFFDTEDGGDMFLRTSVDFNGLHGVTSISQKKIHFITTAMRTSNPTCMCLLNAPVI
jgi:hypothetical protein